MGETVPRTESQEEASFFLICPFHLTFILWMIPRHETYRDPKFSIKLDHTLEVKLCVLVTDNILRDFKIAKQMTEDELCCFKLGG